MRTNTEGISIFFRLAILKERLIVAASHMRISRGRSCCEVVSPKLPCRGSQLTAQLTEVGKMKNRGLVSALLVFVLFGLPLSLQAQGGPGSLAAHTQAQIALLQDEKESRTPDQAKLECQIVYA